MTGARTCFCRDASMHVPEAQLELFGLDNILSLA